MKYSTKVREQHFVHLHIQQTLSLSAPIILLTQRATTSVLLELCMDLKATFIVPVSLILKVIFKYYEAVQHPICIRKSVVHVKSGNKNALDVC